MSAPNPGSREALDLGCVCPVVDNAHGRGFLGGTEDPVTGGLVFVTNEGCPVHGPVSSGEPK